MNLQKELLDFLDANNWLSLEDEENAKGIIASYIKVYKPELHKGQKLPIHNVVGRSEQLFCYHEGSYTLNKDGTCCKCHRPPKPQAK